MDTHQTTQESTSVLPDYNSLFLRACRGEETERTPVWLMRQAGRYQPEYMAIRSQNTFLDMCKKPEIAAQVTLFAADSLGVDAAILFADILLIVECMGLNLSFVKGEGPCIEPVLRDPAQVERLQEIDASQLDYVYQAVKLIRKDLPLSKSLIGFAGAPFTVASYCIEGGSSRDFLNTKTFMLSHPESWHRLMAVLARGTVDYLKRQIDAGASAIQLFDSWAGCLSPQLYSEFVLPHSQYIFGQLPREIVKIHFGKGTGLFLPLLASAGADVIGIDYTTPLPTARQQLGSMCLQGNLDPAYLFTEPSILKQAVERTLAGADGGGHVFNLGHGIVPQTSVEQVKRLVEYVAELSSQ
jgi:uroporphyrinogen decarboxylase